eukprot:scaffold135161_cov118-Phaeocystis_antarctica.AAC.1
MPMPTMPTFSPLGKVLIVYGLICRSSGSAASGLSGPGSTLAPSTVGAGHCCWAWRAGGR